VTWGGKKGGKKKNYNKRISLIAWGKVGAKIKDVETTVEFKWNKEKGRSKKTHKGEGGKKDRNFW